MDRKELAEEIQSFITHAKSVPGADSFNIAVVETVLGSFATWLLGRAEKGTAPKIVSSDDQPREMITAAGEYWHGVDCRKRKINVYHFSDCEGGEDCALFKYLSIEGNPEKHLKNGYEFDVSKNDKGDFVFSDGRKLEDD